MNFRAEVMEKLRNNQSPEANKVRILFEGDDFRAISSEPARTTASEALRLWRTRLRNTKITHKEIFGLSELVSRLEILTPQKKVDYFGFSSKNLAMTVLFEKTSGEYIGSVTVESPEK